MNTVGEKMHPVVGRTFSGLRAQQVFFPSAALFAAVAPWLLLGSLYGWFQPLVDVATHARGMLFGYVGALIAGYLGGKLSASQMAALFGLWLAGRMVEVCADEPRIVNFLYAAFGLYLATIVVPRFAAAKKWRNRIIGPLLTIIICFPIILLAVGASDLSLSLSLHSLVLLIAILMFFMGGRFVTPLLARAYAKKSEKLPKRIQPRLEGAVMLLLLIASLLSVTPAAPVWLAAATGTSGVLVLVRLYRWKLFGLGWRHADLKALGFGYLWLGVGLLVFSLSLSRGLPITASLHIITVGALGTLSTTIMLNLTAKTITRPPAVYYTVILLLFMATIARFLVDTFPVERQMLLIVSALMWSSNFVIAGFFIVPRKGGA